MRGRKPKPVEQKIAEGNPGKRKLPNAPKPKLALPRPPTFMTKEAKKEWRRVIKHLHENQLMSHLDVAALAAYCTHYSRWVEAEKKIQELNTLIIKAPSGYPQNNPYLGIANRSLEMMHKFLVEFGMTPSARARIDLGKSASGEEDPFEEFWRRKRERQERAAEERRKLRVATNE